MKCLVTGAAGFVGSSICDELLARGHEVLGVDCFIDYYPARIKQANLLQAKKSAKFSFTEASLATTDVGALLKGVDWVFHQAAQAGVRASWGASFETYTTNNVLATQRLLEACKQNGSIKRIVYASSSSVYGNAETFPTSEEVTPQPVSPYGVSKLAAEHLMSLYASEFGLPTVSLRYFTVYGPRQRPDMAFHRFLKAALLKKSLTLYGDGEQTRDFTFISDIVEANIASAEMKQATGQVFNLGGGSRISVNDVLSMIREIVGVFEVHRDSRQAGDARHTSADTSAARTALGFAPQVSLKAGLEAEARWIEQNLSLLGA